MTRYQIQLEKPGRILDGLGMIRKVVANTGTKAEVIVYVLDADKEKFEKMLDGAEDVESYFAYPVARKARA